MTASRRLLRNLGVFAAFALMTVVMTWPWAARLRDATIDPGDPYLNAWIMWWDYHQTFHDPLNLFNANVFFPYAYSLAFSEHNYGLALPLFPLYALGLTPLTVHGVAMLLGFTLSGFGAFRLTRTLTGSSGAAWVAGIGFGYTLYRWHHISHVNYLASGWMPLLLEALVLFLRERSRRRAAWLGVAFLMNALSCIHWFVLTLIPLTLTGLLLMLRQGIEREPALWRRGAAALGAASLVLLPFFLPYRQAAKKYGFERGESETLAYSATPRQWLNADPMNRLWRGLGENPSPGELCLFPGLLLLLLPLGALLLVDGEPENVASDRKERPRSLLLALDLIAVAAGTLAVFAAAEPVRLRFGEHLLLKASDPSRAVALFTLVVLVRWCLAWPRAFTFVRQPDLIASLRSGRRDVGVSIGLIWVVVGFFGSLGLRFPFHRILFENVSLFRSIRAPARYAMVADLGLAVLAGIGVLYVARRLRGGEDGARGRLLFAAASVLLFLELRPYPLDPVKGDADPDEVSRYLAKTPMKGGLVQLPSGGDRGNYLYVLRAADHGKPLVNGVSGFVTPIVSRLEEMTRQRPVPDGLLDFLESIPTSYLSVNESWLSQDERKALHPVLANGIAAGRLRYVGRFDGRRRTDLYAVSKVEPNVPPGPPLPWTIDPIAAPLAVDPSVREDPMLWGNLDVPREGTVVTGELRAAGWARIPGEDLHVTLLIDGEQRVWRLGQRVARPDVQTALPSVGDCAAAGFEAFYPFTDGDDGKHEIQVIFRAKDGRVRHFPVKRFEWRR